jgi:hypothetical protein
VRLLGLASEGPRWEHAAYALREIMRRLGVAGEIARPGDSTPSAADFDGILAYGPSKMTLPDETKPTVHVLAHGFFDEGFDTEASVPGLPLPGAGESPALFVAEAEGPPRAGHVVVLREDLVASTYFLLAGHEERARPVWDEHGRFDGLASLPHRAGFLGRPVVEDWTARIAEAFARAGLTIPGRPGWPGGERCAAILTSDVDLPRRNTWRATARRLLGLPVGVAIEGEQAPGAFSYIPRGLGRDPYFDLDRLARKGPGGREAWTFFFLAGRRGERETYDLAANPALARQARQLADRGVEIGFHAPYDCWLRPERFTQALDAFEKAVGTRPRGVRQHYLRFRVPRTWRAQAQAGLAYDASAAFAPHEGFRFGTALPFEAFDGEKGQRLGLWVLPLAAMDVTLRARRGLSPEDAGETLRALADEVRRVGGAFSLLWHNSSTGPEWRDWEEVFDTFLDHLAEEGVWASNGAGLIDAWRRTADLVS